jgi:antitoxin component YwqK of YwqJK toxin-antitoxin module
MQEYKVKVNTNGDKFWYKNGKLHREDGPACEYANGDKAWNQNGKCHREDGPALEYANGNREWFKNGKLHREDGPAIEDAYGYKAWYINGKELTEEEFNNRNNKVEVTLKDIAKAMNIDIDKLRIKEH